MLIYKIFRTPEWVVLRDTGTTRGAPIDLTDGYIHFSTGAQVADTCRLHFAGIEGSDWFFDQVNMPVKSDGLKDLYKSGDMRRFINECVRQEKVIVICGATGSGNQSDEDDACAVLTN